jgi:hypothetical protein
MPSHELCKKIWQRGNPGITDAEVTARLAFLYQLAEIKINIELDNLPSQTPQPDECNTILQGIF